MSLLLPPSHTTIPLVALAAGLAAADAIRSSTSLEVGLEWPNDLVVDDAKLAGILVETEMGLGTVLGVGINLTVDRFPPGIPGISLHALVAEPPSPQALLEALLRALARRLHQLESGGVGALRPDWSSMATQLHKRVAGWSAEGYVSGRAIGIDDDGLLLVESDARVHRLLALPPRVR